MVNSHHLRQFEAVSHLAIASECSDMYMYGRQLLKQKIGYDKAAAVAKRAHKEGTTLKVRIIHKGRLTFWTSECCC